MTVTEIGHVYEYAENAKLAQLASSRRIGPFWHSQQILTRDLSLSQPFWAILAATVYHEIFRDFEFWSDSESTDARNIFSSLAYIFQNLYNLQIQFQANVYYFDCTFVFFHLFRSAGIHPFPI